jgi:hypothetical protein
LPLRTAQKRQPRVQTSPRSMKVAVPPPQHSPMFGQRASSQTVWRSRSRRMPFRSAWTGPPGSRTLSQAGFGPGRTVRDALLMNLGRRESLGGAGSESMREGLGRPRWRTP